MPATLLGSLLVSLGLESGEFKSGLSQAEKELRASTKRFQKIGQGMTDLGTKLSIGVTAPLIALSAKAVQGFQEQAQAMAQVNSALKSMGDVSGKTSEELAKTADALEMNSLFDAEVILQQVTAQLLTFGNVAGDVFDRAQQAAVDMATRLGGEPQAAAIMLGKALNDPVKGISALSRVGVQFTEQQKKTIKSFVDTGQVAKAQGVILAEVERQFKGAAAAAADTSPWRKAQVAIGQAMDTIGEAILPIIKPVADAIASVAQAFNSLPPGMQRVVIVAGVLAAALGPVLTLVGSLVTTFAPLIAVLGKIGASGGVLLAVQSGFAGLLTVIAPIAVPLAAIAAAGYLIYQNWDKIGPVLQEFWTAAQEALGPALQELIEAISALFNELWNGPLGEEIKKAGQALVDFNVAYGKAMGPVFIQGLKLVIETFANLVRVISDGVGTISKLLKGDFAGSAESAMAIVNRVFMGIPEIIAKTVTAIREWLINKLGAVWKTVTDKVSAVTAAFRNMYEAVVGHSYVPDMVDGIAAQMARLDAVMVNPAKKAAERTKQVFQKLQEDVRSAMENLFPEAREAASLASQRTALQQGIKAGGAGGFTVAQLQAGLDRMNENALAPIKDALADLFGFAVSGFESVGAGAASLAERIGDELPEAIIKANAGLIAIREAGEYAMDSLADGLADAVLGFRSFGDVVRSVVADLAKLALKGLFKSILGGGSGGGGLLGGILGSIKGFAGGTNYAPGGMALVGERGPELVNLPRGSQVIPNKDLRAANNNSWNVSIAVNGAMDDASARHTADQIASQLRRRMTPMRGM